MCFRIRVCKDASTCVFERAVLDMKSKDLTSTLKRLQELLNNATVKNWPQTQ
jgi:hypothetical protein